MRRAFCMGRVTTWPGTMAAGLSLLHSEQQMQKRLPHPGASPSTSNQIHVIHGQMGVVIRLGRVRGRWKSAAAESFRATAAQPARVGHKLRMVQRWLLYVTCRLSACGHHFYIIGRETSSVTVSDLLLVCKQPIHLSTSSAILNFPK